MHIKKGENGNSTPPSLAACSAGLHICRAFVMKEALSVSLQNWKGFLQGTSNKLVSPSFYANYVGDRDQRGSPKKGGHDSPAEARRRPSGEKARAKMVPRWEGRVRTTRPSCTDHSRRHRSLDPVAT